MTTDIRLISIGASTTFYFVNSSGAPTVGGAITGASTTALAMLNDQWTMQPAIPKSVYAGGPPIYDGATLAYENFDNTQQTIPFSISGSSHDNTASIMRQIRQVLAGAAQTTAGILLYYQPSGATNALYYVVKTGYVIERTDTLNPAGGFAYVEADMIVTLAPFGGRISSGETLINAQSFTNTGSADANVKAFSAGSGDMIYAGGPVNYAISSFSATTCTEIWLASIAAHGYSGGIGTSLATTALASSPASASSGFITDTSITPSNRIKMRLLFRITNPSSNLRVSGRIVLSTGGIIWTSSTFVAPVAVGATKNTLVDIGYAPGDYFRNNNATTSTVFAQIMYYSTDGSTTTGTWDSCEILFYYDICKIARYFPNPTSTMDTINTSSFREVSNYAALPIVSPGIRARLSSGDVGGTYVGTLPRYYSGASLWAAWMKSSIHTSTETVTISATHGPLYNSMRGAG